MGKFVKGDVVAVPFPFTDLTGQKKRPAFVVVPLRGDDVILCMITTRSKRDEYSIDLTSTHFVEGGLPEPSVIRPNRLFTADTKIIDSKRGRATPSKSNEVIEKIIALLRE